MPEDVGAEGRWCRFYFLPEPILTNCPIPTLRAALVRSELIDEPPAMFHFRPFLTTIKCFLPMRQPHPICQHYYRLVSSPFHCIAAKVGGSAADGSSREIWLLLPRFTSAPFRAA